MNIKTFWYSSPYSSPVMKVGRRTFDSSHHIYLRRRRQAMELIAIRWESSLMTLVIHRRSECPNPLLRTSCSIVLDRNVVWRKLWCHRIYVNFTPSNERFFCIDTFARRADDLSFMTWLARPVIQSLYDGSLIFFPEKRRRGNVL